MHNRVILHVCASSENRNGSGVSRWHQPELRRPATSGQKYWGRNLFGPLATRVHSLKPARRDPRIYFLVLSFLSQRRQLALPRQITEISPSRMCRPGGAAVKHQKKGEDTRARPKIRSGGGESSPDVLEPLQSSKAQKPTQRFIVIRSGAGGGEKPQILLLVIYGSHLTKG